MKLYGGHNIVITSVTKVRCFDAADEKQIPRRAEALLVMTILWLS